MDEHDLLSRMHAASSPNDISSAISEARAWLAEHPDDDEVRNAIRDLARQERERWGLSFA
jgi:hypothetical protein